MLKSGYNKIDGTPFGIKRELERVTNEAIKKAQKNGKKVKKTTSKPVKRSYTRSRNTSTVDNYKK